MTGGDTCRDCRGRRRKFNPNKECRNEEAFNQAEYDGPGQGRLGTEIAVLSVNHKELGSRAVGDR